MARNETSHARNWKKWVAISVAVVAVVYLVVYLLFFTGGGGAGGGGFHY